MPSDTAPDNVCPSRDNWIAILEGGAAIIGPGHFENTGGTLNALDSESLPKAALVPQVFNELFDGREKSSLLRGRQRIEIRAEAR